MGISISIEESSGTRHGKPVKPNMILPPRRTIPRISNNLKYCEKSPHIGQWGIFKYSDNILISAWPVQWRHSCRPIFPQDQLPFPTLYFIVGLRRRCKTGCINVWGGIFRQFRCSGLRFLILKAGQEMSHNCDRRFNWGSILVSETHLTRTICPQMWKYACSVKVIDESTGSRSGDASLEFAQCCSLVSECPTNYCN